MKDEGMKDEGGRMKMHRGRVNCTLAVFILGLLK